MAVWRHAFVYFWLIFGTIAALGEERLEATVAAWSLVVIAGLGLWYGYWHVAGMALRHPWGGRIYLVGGLAAWALLLALEPAFLVVGVSVLAPHCLDDLRWALALLVPCSAAWLWQQAAAAGGLDWSEVAVPLVLLASLGAVAAYIRTLARQNSEHQRLIDKLRAAQSELAAAERQAGRLAERQRLARDIHDTLTQGFASIVMLLEAAEATRRPGDSAARHIAAALRSARDNLAESRRVVWALRPNALADGQLPDALTELLTRLRDETDVRTELVVTGTPRRLGPEVEPALLRFTQEALANVRKHAGATRVTATISYMEDVIALDIQDDGAGFDPAVAGRSNGAGGLGLRAMRERIEELGGRLSVETLPGEGTTVVAELPASVDGGQE